MPTRMAPVTRALLVVNLVVFALQMVTGDLLPRYFALWPPASPQYPGAGHFQI